MGDISKLISSKLALGAPIRLYLTADRRDYAISRAKEVEELALKAGHIVRRLRPTLASIMETRAFSRDLLDDARSELVAARAGGPPRWLIASLGLESSDLSGCVEPVPIAVHLEAGRTVFGPLLREFPRYEASGASVHGVGVDCSYPAIISSRDVLDVPDDADIDPEAGDGKWLSLANLRDALNEAIADRGRITEEAALVRLTLIRMALSDTLPGPEFQVWIDRVLKDGNVLLIRARRLHDSTTYGYWCKFGSTAELRIERKNWEQLSAAKLYKVLDLRELPADYTSILFSKADADFATTHVDFEEWIGSRRTSENDPDVKGVLATLDTFFDDMHLIDARVGVPSRSRVMRILGARCFRPPRSRKSDEPFPLRLAPKGDYKLLFVKPRDAEGKVRFVLEAPDGSRRLVDWKKNDWRYRLWSLDIREGAQVELATKARWAEARREDFFTFFSTLSTNYQMHTKRVKERVDAILAGGSTKARTMSVDLLASTVHGDLHPRNVVLLGTERGGERRWDLRVVDVADAILPDDSRDSMSHDFVTFEVDLRLRALYDRRDADDRPALIERCLAFETALWRWCVDTCGLTTPNISAFDVWARFPASAPMREGFRPIALWRHGALSRLAAAASYLNWKPTAAEWLPVVSYAERLLLVSVAYMEYLDVTNGDDQARAIHCLAMASIAIDVLDTAMDVDGDSSEIGKGVTNEIDASI